MLNQWSTREKRLLLITCLLSILVISQLAASWTKKEQSQAAVLTLHHELETAQAQQLSKEQDQVPDLKNDLESKKQESMMLEEKVIMIDIKGAVKQPDVYAIGENARVRDAVIEAGGLTEDANTTYLNLAQKLTDGMVIYVPTNEEVEQGGEQVIGTNPSQYITSSSISTVDGSGEAAGGGKININQASASQLETLPGIGPSRAEAIIKYREEKGGFKQIEELMNVSGIGTKIFEGLKDLITI